MPTFADLFVSELARSGFAEQLTWWDGLFVQIQKMNEASMQMTRAIADRAEENFPSKAYGPYLEARGFTPFLAKGLGSLTISPATRQANEDKGGGTHR